MDIAFLKGPRHSFVNVNLNGLALIVHCMCRLAQQLIAQMAAHVSSHRLAFPPAIVPHA